MVEALKVGSGALVFLSDRVSMQPLLEKSVVLGTALWAGESGQGRIAPQTLASHVAWASDLSCLSFCYSLGSRDGCAHPTQWA